MGCWLRWERMWFLGINYTTPRGIVNIAASDSSKMKSCWTELKFLVKDHTDQVSSLQESPYKFHACKRCEIGKTIGLMRAPIVLLLCYENCRLLLPLHCYCFWAQHQSLCNYNIILPNDVCTPLLSIVGLCWVVFIFEVLKHVYPCTCSFFMHICVVAEHWYLMSKRTECL